MKLIEDGKVFLITIIVMLALVLIPKMAFGMVDVDTIIKEKTTSLVDKLFEDIDMNIGN